MLAVMIIMTPYSVNESIDCQKCMIWIPVLPLMDVKTWWNSALLKRKWAYWLCKFNHNWRNYQKDSPIQPLFAILDGCMSSMSVNNKGNNLYWTLWIFKRLSEIFSVITAHSNKLFIVIDSVKHASAYKCTLYNEDLHNTVMFACQEIFTHHAEVTPIDSILRMSTCKIDSLDNSRLIWKWRMGIDLNR